jgi:hypothetical protein
MLVLIWCWGRTVIRRRSAFLLSPILMRRRSPNSMMLPSCARAESHSCSGRSTVAYRGRRMEKILADLAQNRDCLERVRQQGMAYARECLTWDAKAQRTTQVLDWVVRRGPKPNLPPPKGKDGASMSETTTVSRSTMNPSRACVS